MTTHLDQLVNIGSALAERLSEAGISDVDQLRRLGSVKTLVRIGAQGRPGCYNMLYAIEGAIRGIRWYEIPANDRAWLKEQLDEFKKHLKADAHADA